MSPSTVYQLSRTTREKFEDTFHSDFKRVRIHFSQQPARYGAVAFASGDNVVLLPELLSADSPAALAILAHELTHVVQQRRSRLGMGLLHNRELEAEAQAWEPRFAGPSNPAALFDVSKDSARNGAVIQCASAAFSTMASPGPTISGGLEYFKNEKIKKSFREAIEHYVRLIRPGDVGVNGATSPGDSRKQYVRVLYARIESKPYLLKELVADEKVSFADLPPADRRWVMDELYRAWDLLRKGPHMFVTTRICLGHTPSWLDFRTQDCVFAAILHTLVNIESKRVDPTKIKGRDSGPVILQTERDEAAMETWLAAYFGVARKITPDVQIIHILESELGWKNMSEVKKFSDLKGGAYKGKSYIVSYEKTAGTKDTDAFWHTVYVDVASNGNPKVTDRQATGLGFSGSVVETAKCDAWLINLETIGYLAMKQAFDDRT